MIRHPNAIRDFRRSKSPVWTQADLAVAVGCTQADISAYETGRVAPDLRRAFAIAHALGKTAHAVFFGISDDTAADVGHRLLCRNDKTP